jgi:hypothetical protein
MSVVKRIVCLANSRKLSGRCVAGKELVSKGAGQWLRPVSDRPSEEVSEKEREYENGSDPKVRDIIDVPLKEHRPKAFQTENWLLDPTIYWKRVGEMTWNELAGFSDDPAELWLNGQSTGAGLNDRVSLADSGNLTNSLYLLHLDRMAVRVFAPGEYFGDPKRRVQADFAHRRVNYHLWVTDPIIEKKYLAGKDGDFSIGECFITVSLGEPHKGYCYKLVATVIPK